MVNPVEDVEEPQRDKAQERLMPSGIKANKAGIAAEFEHAIRAVRQ